MDLQRYIYYDVVLVSEVGVIIMKKNIDLKTFCFLFESLCQRDLEMYAESFNANVYHYMDYSNNEIDAVVELDDGRWCICRSDNGVKRLKGKDYL